MLPLLIFVPLSNHDCVHNSINYFSLVLARCVVLGFFRVVFFLFVCSFFFKFSAAAVSPHNPIAESKQGLARSERTAVRAEAYFRRRGVLFPRIAVSLRNFHDLQNVCFGWRVIYFATGLSYHFCYTLRSLKCKDKK